MKRQKRVEIQPLLNDSLFIFGSFWLETFDSPTRNYGSPGPYKGTVPSYCENCVWLGIVLWYGYCLETREDKAYKWLSILIFYITSFSDHNIRPAGRESIVEVVV